MNPSQSISEWIEKAMLVMYGKESRMRDPHESDGWHTLHLPTIK